MKHSDLSPDGTRLLAREIVAALRDDLRALLLELRDEVSREVAPQRTPETRTLRVGGLVLDLDRHEATLDGQPLALKPREFAVLTALAKHPGHVLSREQLLEAAWSNVAEDLDNDRVVDVQVYRLRHKLGAEARRLQTVTGLGYRLQDRQ